MTNERQKGSKVMSNARPPCMDIWGDYYKQKGIKVMKSVTRGHSTNEPVEPSPISSEGSERLTPTEKALKNPRSLRFAINAKCYDCCCFQRTEVRDCTAMDCPLWNVRPWQKVVKDD